MEVIVKNKVQHFYGSQFTLQHKTQNCPYHLTFDLEHNLDARSPGDHCVQVWSQSGYLLARKSDFRDITKVPVIT